MFDNKFLITLIGLIVAVVAINNIKSKDEDVVEGLGMLPSFTFRTDTMVSPDKTQAELYNFTSAGQNTILRGKKPITYKSLAQDQKEYFKAPDTYKNSVEGQKGEFFTVPGTYQSHLNPRFSNTDYGANIRYNMPSKINQAVPTNPLTFGGMASRENFRTRNENDSGTGVPSCGKGGAEQCNRGGGQQYYHRGGDPYYHGGAPLTEPGFAAGNYTQATNNIYEEGNKKHARLNENAANHEYSEGNLPVSDMTSASMNGEPAPVVYTRLIVANRSNTRLRSQGDMIRGDLAIVPCNADWFRPSVTPHVDLQQGALNVMGGIQNEQGQNLDSLIYKSSGFTDTTLSGTNDNPGQTTTFNERRSRLSGGTGGKSNVNMSNDLSGTTSAYQGDILVSGFP